MRRFAAFILFLGVVAGCKNSGSEANPDKAPMTIQLTSPAFQEGETIPKQYTADGKNISVPLRWSNVPEGTKSFVLICEDPDAPSGNWVHWILFDLPGDQRELAEATPGQETLSNGAKQGKNSFGRTGYSGPAPPSGNAHRYYFRLYALDKLLDLTAATSKDLIEAAMKGHVLAKGELMGKYGR